MENNNKNKGPNKNRQGWGIVTCSFVFAKQKK